MFHFIYPAAKLLSTSPSNWVIFYEYKPLLFITTPYPILGYDQDIRPPGYYAPLQLRSEKLVVHDIRFHFKFV